MFHNCFIALCLASLNVVQVHISCLLHFGISFFVKHPLALFLISFSYLAWCQQRHDTFGYCALYKYTFFFFFTTLYAVYQALLSAPEKGNWWYRPNDMLFIKRAPLMISTVQNMHYEGCIIPASSLSLLAFLLKGSQEPDLQNRKGLAWAPSICAPRETGRLCFAVFNPTMQLGWRPLQCTCGFGCPEIAVLPTTSSPDCTFYYCFIFQILRLAGVGGCRSSTMFLLNRLQVVQNSAARLLLKLPPRSHMSFHLKTLHWLPIKKRILFKAMVLMHKALHDAGAVYLRERINKYIPARTLWSSSAHLSSVPRINRLGVGGRFFSYLGPLTWNKLPKDLRMVSNLAAFKKKLKTWLFM